MQLTQHRAFRYNLLSEREWFSLFLETSFSHYVSLYVRMTIHRIVTFIVMIRSLLCVIATRKFFSSFIYDSFVLHTWFLSSFFFHSIQKNCERIFYSPILSPINVDDIEWYRRRKKWWRWSFMHTIFGSTTFFWVPLFYVRSDRARFYFNVSNRFYVEHTFRGVFERLKFFRTQRR